MSYYEEMKTFCTCEDYPRFVDPEKVEAVQLFGLEKAKEIWANGGPDYQQRNLLTLSACNRAVTKN